MNQLSATLLTRRSLLASASVATLGALGLPAWGASPTRRPRVAAIFTELRFRSHAFNILENFFQPYLFRGEFVDPGCEVVSFFADQFPADDMAREASQQLGVPLFKSIDEAVCVGGKKLAVDAVLLIGEHGEYPYNELGQHLYPRKQFFDQIVAVMRRSGRYVPLFNDKHLSYRWDWAREMYDTARQHGMPMLAGSSVPLAERRPEWELPPDAEIEEAVSIHGGGMESYDFHAFELLQSIVESRRGGETGVAKIETLAGDALQRAGDAGRWSRELFTAAMRSEAEMHPARQTRPLPNTRPSAIAEPDNPDQIKHAILVTYRDGLRATVFAVGNTSNRWNFACRLKGDAKPRSLAIYNGPWGNRCLFKALSHAIQHLFAHGAEPYPLERTLLTTGMTEAVMKSHTGGQPVETPHLAISYRSPDWRDFRENGESWKILTSDSPQSQKFEPGDKR
jgi:hypothetical protein